MVPYDLEDMRFRRLSGDPEEYGVFLPWGRKVAHVRMSSGILIMEAPDKGYKRIWAEEPGGDTVLTAEDRPKYLKRFKYAIMRYLNTGEAYV